ncbi:unnamed protein product [Durusdinium trenchii]|uniref:PI3K/PI4K catalytic domain-containing protein n=1 Tax=Durusdinium trenchii TaxID=1381693 RepID=A0ABP0R6G8_9DINO
MACADVVLYVWVDDAFVRHHKKLVQVHYFVEILTRLPLLCLLLNMESVGYIALLSLLACDLSASVLLLLMPTLLGWRRRMSCRHASSQVASAVIMSEILFFVNITMFDPREAFQVINMGFYIVKYLEAFIVCRILPWSIRSGEFRTTFQEVQLAAVVLNAFLVWVVVPKLRSMQDAAMSHARQDMPRLSELVPRDERDAHPSASRSQFFGLPETIALELSTVGSPQHVVRENRVESARLELLGDMLEGLCLTSEAQSDRNRPAVARSTVADVLWSLVLPWSGEYVESTSGGRIWLEILDPERGAILIRRERSSSDPDPSVGRWVESLGVVFQGTAIEAVLDVAEGRVLGTHTGEEIRFADANGTIWRRGIVEGSSGSSGSSSSSSSSSSGAREQESAAREVLRLVLTQVLLSLRWEPTFLGLGVVGAGKAKAGDLVAIDAARRPLLSFLLRYAIGTHDLSFISEIYWSLWCLSQDYLDPNRAAYDKARWVLINALEGNIEFWDSIRGVQLDQWAIQNKSGKSNPEADADKAFRDKALGLIAQQAALWQQTMQLAALGRETAGDTAEKTRAIRHRLHEMKQREDQATDPEERYLVYLEDSYLLERLEVDASLLAATQAASLVRQPRDFRSTPVDPSVPFLGVNIGEILKSNAAPLLLGCLQEPDSGCGLDLEAGDGMRRTRQALTGPQVDRYMVKVGDDLRQDQLVLQMLHLMELVWQERLPKEENDMLRFVPYRVLAMTPSGGYIKFVPGAVSLSKALAQSNGDLMSWFSSNLPEHMTKDQVLNNLCGSAAAYCVATYAQPSDRRAEISPCEHRELVRTPTRRPLSRCRMHRAHRGPWRPKPTRWAVVALALGRRAWVTTLSEEFGRRWAPLAAALARPKRYADEFLGSRGFHRLPGLAGAAHLYGWAGESESEDERWLPKPPTCPKTGLKMYYPLDLASAMPVLSLINQTEQSTGRSTEVVVDTCAAPGGKFLVMAGFYLPSTSARLIAIEWDNFRLSRFKQNLRLYLPSDLRKSARLTVRRGDASKILSQLPNGPFDAVLVDAPCSSERERLLRANGRPVNIPGLKEVLEKSTGTVVGDTPGFSDIPGVELECTRLIRDPKKNVLFFDLWISRWLWKGRPSSFEERKTVPTVLGIGDRHLDNLQITPEGHFFHIDFGFIFGEDPKPFAPRLRLPQQIASVLMKEADHGTSGTLLDRCFHLAGRAYIALRRSMTLWVSLLRVTGRAGGAGCACLRQDANAAVVVVTDRLRSDLGGYEEFGFSSLTNTLFNMVLFASWWVYLDPAELTCVGVLVPKNAHRDLNS